jgi:hypothetical protein
MTRRNNFEAIQIIRFSWERKEISCGLFDDAFSTGPNGIGWVTVELGRIWKEAVVL